MNESFEKWARFKGYDLKCQPGNENVYEDPITQAAWEGYCIAGIEKELFWHPRYEAAMTVIDKNGLEEAYKKQLPVWEQRWKKLYPRKEPSSASS